MKTTKELNEEIIKITDEIRANFPELLDYLNEMPVTIPDESNPEITDKALLDYYNSLVAVLKEYESSHLKSLKIKKMGLSNTDLNTDIDNMKLSYSYAGEGTIPIIFLHGFPFDKTMWKEQIDYFKKGACVISLDLRGFGKSQDQSSGLSIDIFANDLVLFMNEFEIEKAVVCGLSMGGYVALNAVKKFPERFEALILCDTQCKADSEEGRMKRYETIEQIKLNGTADFNENFIKSVFHPDSFANHPEVVENLRKTVESNSKEIIMEGLSALANRAETCSSLADIKIPTLIVCGNEDMLTPVSQSEYMHKKIKGSVLKIIENAGHVSNLEQPEAFNLLLKEFLITINAVKYNEPNSEPMVPKVKTEEGLN